MNLSLPRAVIFDWDNTLVDSWGAISEAVNYTRALHGLKTWNREEILANCTRSARDAFPDWFGDKWQEAWEQYYTYFAKIREEMGITPAEGATDLLSWLKENDIPSLVVSNKSGEYLRQEAAHLGWKDYFAAIVGAHDAPRDKPCREHADWALNLAGLLNGSDIWFVGDSETDVACAKNSECTPVLLGTADDAKKLKVGLFFASFPLLLGSLKQMKSETAES